MKKSSIRLDQDLIRELNLYKYKFHLKSISQVIRRLFEICSKVETADNLNSAEKLNTTTPSFSSGQSSSDDTTSSGGVPISNTHKTDSKVSTIKDKGESKE